MYDVVGLLGRGGSAVVELAVDGQGRRVATKRLALTGSASQIHVARQRLRREAAILGRLNHPGIVPVLDVVDDGTEVVLVLPALAENLEDRVARLGPLPPVEVARIGRVLIDALSAAHRQGVVHRDIKPANVLFDLQGRPALADFGVASTRDVTAGLTMDGFVVGTPMWMAPEQARGDGAGPASDVWALAATLVYAATGQGPYPGGSPEAVLARAAGGDVRPVPEAVPAVLRRPLVQMLDARPGRRPSAAAVLGGLHGTMVARAPEAERPPRRWPGRLRRRATAIAVGRPDGPRRPSRRRRVLVGTAGLAGLIAVALVVALGTGVLDHARAKKVLHPTMGPSASGMHCTSELYQPCGQPAAPHTDGVTCDPGWYDLDGNTADGCEAQSDFSATDAVLTQNSPVQANLVPATATDTFTTHVDGDSLNLCWGSLHVTLRSAPNTAEQLVVLHHGHPQGDPAVSLDGKPATVTVDKPSCFGSDSEDLTLQVSASLPSSITTPADFTLTRDGGW